MRTRRLCCAVYSDSLLPDVVVPLVFVGEGAAARVDYLVVEGPEHLVI